MDLLTLVIIIVLYISTPFFIDDWLRRKRAAAYEKRTKEVFATANGYKKKLSSHLPEGEGYTLGQITTFHDTNNFQCKFTVCIFIGDDRELSNYVGSIDFWVFDAKDIGDISIKLYQQDEVEVDKLDCVHKMLSKLLA